MSRDADRPEWDRIGGERVSEDLGAREVDADDRRTHPLRTGLPLDDTQQKQSPESSAPVGTPNSAFGSPHLPDPPPYLGMKP